jgi:hypothetical protein
MSPPILFYFFREFSHYGDKKNILISFSFLVVNLKKMENTAELLKPKKF